MNDPSSKIIQPVFFESEKEFRKWLEKNHQKASEIFVGFYKLHTGKPSLSWSESVDQALCFGWIDGVRKSIDEDSYQIRFTPRKKSSIWSKINIEKVERLIQLGQMTEKGIEAYQYRTEEKSKVYSFEKKDVTFSQEYESEFKANKSAYAYFQSLAAAYKKSSIHWVMSAKQTTTQQKRLKELIAYSEAQTNPWKNNKYKK
ncbi:MAG TPA: YdeI/OmpD-associated family protein [Saprospiraceae bacterium]|nr:YdeI/OmpD-associated family protein [Saprospiraceae bacterium]